MLFILALLFAVAIWASLETLRPGDHKDRSITPIVAALVWLVAFLAVAFVLTVRA